MYGLMGNYLMIPKLGVGATAFYVMTNQPDDDGWVNYIKKKVS